MIDNLFVVESPLQALVAVELSLRFKNKKNVIVYRLSDKKRKRNNEQIEEVIKYGAWFQTKKISFVNKNALTSHLSTIKFLRNIEKEFNQRVVQLFIGEFRSQWMHFMRAAVAPEKTILMDDGAATVTVKRKFLNEGIYFPDILWENKNPLRRGIRKVLYNRFLKQGILKCHIYLASAFFKNESLYAVDFTNLKKIFRASEIKSTKNKVLFLGSKYSESKIISLEYELKFIDRVNSFYLNYGYDLIYSAHRDESEEKLKVIKEVIGVEVIIPELPAEINILKNSSSIVEIASAYSSVLNNARILVPEIKVRAFHLQPEELNLKHKGDILLVYKHFENEGITVEFNE